MDLRAKSPADQAWIEQLLTECWGGTAIVVGAAERLPALIAGEDLDLATDRFGRRAELITLEPQRGVGWALAPGPGQLCRSAS